MRPFRTIVGLAVVGSLTLWGAPALAADTLFPTSPGDGDSWEAGDGAEYRLALVNTPELDEECGPEAAEYRRALTAGGFQVQQRTNGQAAFGRVTAILVTPAGLDIGLDLARKGYADDRYLERYRSEVSGAYAREMEQAFRAGAASATGRQCGVADAGRADQGLPTEEDEAHAAWIVGLAATGAVAAAILAAPGRWAAAAKLALEQQQIDAENARVAAAAEAERVAAEAEAARQAAAAAAKAEADRQAAKPAPKRRRSRSLRRRPAAAGRARTRATPDPAATPPAARPGSPARRRLVDPPVFSVSAGQGLFAGLAPGIIRTCVRHSMWPQSRASAWSCCRLRCSRPSARCRS